MKFSAIFIAIVLSFTFACGPDEDAAPAFVEDIVKAAPENAELLFENDHVAVVRFTVPPQASLPAHPGQDRIIYSLSDYKLEFARDPETKSINDHRTGDIEWRSSGTHSVRNVGPITARYLTVSRKSPNPTPGVTSNLAELAPEKAKVVFENEDAKVIEISLEPGDKLPAHAGASRVIYALTPLKIRFTSADGSSEQELAEGQALWQDGGEHEVECLSETPVRYLVFELM